MINKDFRKVKNISKELLDYYQKYYERNATKFFSKWDYKTNAIGSIFIKENEEFSLIGQVSDATFLLRKPLDESIYFVDGNFLSKEFTKKA